MVSPPTSLKLASTKMSQRQVCTDLRDRPSPPPHRCFSPPHRQSLQGDLQFAHPGTRMPERVICLPFLFQPTAFLRKICRPLLTPPSSALGRCQPLRLPPNKGDPAYCGYQSFPRLRVTLAAPTRLPPPTTYTPEPDQQVESRHQTDTKF